jgi:hypothetical protein
MRQNLSPGPSYKMKERNSMFDQRNKNNNEGEINQKLIMIKPNQFCSSINESLIQKSVSSTTAKKARPLFNDPKKGTKPLN